MQIVQSYKTLRRYLQQLDKPDKQIKTTSSIMEPSENLSIPKTNTDITVKCESLEPRNVIDNMTEPVNNNSLPSTECALNKDGYSEISCEDTKIGIAALNEDISTNWIEREPRRLKSANEIKDEIFLKSENQTDNLTGPEYIVDLRNTNANDGIYVKCESLELQDVFEGGGLTNDNSLFSRECADDILSKHAGSKIGCEDTKNGVGDIMLDENMAVNWIDEKPGKFNSADTLNPEVSLKSEQQADELIRTDYNDCPGNASGNCSNLRSVDVKHDKRKENNKNISTYPMKHKIGNIKIKIPYKCAVCNKCFTSSSNLNVHNRTHTHEKPYKCHVCQKCFTTSSDLKVHNRTHTREKPYKCDVCNSSFTQLCHLNKHKNTHTGVKPFKCDVCNKCFNTSNELKVHKRSHTGVKPYRCAVCNKCFTTSGDLIVHNRTHTREKPYKCDVCNTRFTQLCHLNKHKHAHTGVKPFKCDVCNKCFTSSSNLKVHNRTHTREKPYKCDVCNNSFTQLCHLNNHKRTHTGVILHKCDVCNNRFTTSSYLNLHKRMHTGEKPYKCEDCIKCFSDLNSLKYHKRTHTDVKLHNGDV